MIHMFYILEYSWFGI